MLKNKFFKNLFQSISVFVAISLIYIPCTFGFFESLKYASNLGWILFGFYWIFQKVIIDERGIKITLLNKILKERKWDEIDYIEETNFMKNPAIMIKLIDGSEIYLDRRKSIIILIEIYSQKKMKWYSKKPKWYQ